MRLGEADRCRLRQFGAEVVALAAEEDSLALMTDRLGEFLGIEMPVSYGLACEGGQVRAAFGHGGMGRAFSAAVNESLAADPVGWARYNPFSPEPRQRNRVVVTEPDALASFGQYSLLRRLRIERKRQLRVLLCDGPALLAWVGGIHEDPITARQRALLAGLVPILARRLTIERRLALAEPTLRALEVALDQLGGAAFILGPRCAVWHATAAGWDQLARDAAGTAERLATASRGIASTFEVHRIGSGGLLAIERPQRDAGVWASRAAARWGLTRRQTEVLRLIAQGHTNARIAAELGLALGTAELHVSSILQRADCENRAGLIAAIFDHG